MAYNTDLTHLHPIMREKVKAVIANLEQNTIPLKLIEGYRSPVRQEELHNQGAAEQPWKSPFQYGLACEFVLVDDVQNTGADSNEYWSQLAKFAKAAELEVSDAEKSQLVSPGVDVKELFKGHYPEGGDESWAKNLEVHITYWTKYPKPPVPSLGNSQVPHLDDRDEKSTQ